MSYQVCIDIGGTFTDCLIAKPDGSLAIFKSPTTPGEFEKGFMNVLDVAAEGFNLDPKTFLNEIELIVHGSTVSTNALVEKKTVKVGLLLNEGHEDILTLREGPRKGAFEWRLDYPTPFVPRHLTRPVRGRINARGEEITPLSEEDIVTAIGHFRALGVEAIAVGLLWSVVNPEHERRVRAVISRHWPEVPVTLSHEINPMSREYRRVIAAALDAAINPIVRTYVEKLQGALAQAGFGGEFLLANCVGGMMPPKEMIRRPIYSVMSGPTLAPMAALALTEEANVIVGDMGGTTFDVSALRDHQIIVTADSMIHDDSLGIAKVDVRSVGAGGGSIAWLDEGGLLNVGPHSAGARPGPACYDRGGTDATVTDANVVLGIIDPDYFLGGRMQIRRDLAEEAVGRIADQMGVSLHEAAYAIYTTSNHSMVGAIEEITIREGLNPRDSFFVCGGGATAIHIAEMADILGLTRYMIPRYMAGISAFGGLISDLRRDENRVHFSSDRAFNPNEISSVLSEMRESGQHFLDQAGVPKDRQRFEFSFLGRYEFQSWEIEVPVEADEARLRTEDLPTLVESFHRMHERIYSIRSDGEMVEFTGWRMRAIGKRANQDRWKDYLLSDHEGPVSPKTVRDVYLQDRRGTVPLPVYDLNDLGAGAVIPGPALVESRTFTAFLKSGHEAAIDRGGNLIVTVQPSEAQKNA